MTELRDVEVRALHRIVEEVRHSLPPEFDWEGVERRTLASIELVALQEAAPSPPPSGIRRALGFALVVAALLGLLAAQGEPRRAARAAAAAPSGEASTAELSEVSLPSLAPGTRLLSGERPLRLAWHGAARITLEPRASAVIGRAGGAPSLDLERGVAVIVAAPRQPASGGPPSIVVHAGNVRVAATDASFTVAAGPEGVTTKVELGRVELGRVELGRAELGRAASPTSTLAAPGRMHASWGETAPRAEREPAAGDGRR